MLRSTILAAARNETVKHLVATAPVSRDVVARFVGGDNLDEALERTRELAAKGLHVSLDRLGEDTTDLRQAQATTSAYLSLLGRLADEGLSEHAEVSLKLTAVGQSLSESVALDNARTVCAAAAAAGTTVTLDMEDHTTTDSTLSILAGLRPDFPSTAAVIQAYLHRSEADCRDLAQIGGQRVRLCKGAYDEPDSVAFQSRREVDLSYVRCLKALAAGSGYPMVATHDPRLVPVADTVLRRAGRRQGDYEYQMLYGIRPNEQERLAAAGETVRVYLPYGDEWYGYLMRRLAERPANVVFFLRSLITKN